MSVTSNRRATVTEDGLQDALDLLEEVARSAY